MIQQIIFFLGRILFIFKKRQFSSQPKKIIIIKIGAIGDILMSTPLIRSIKDIYPKSSLVYVVGKWSREVLEGNPYIDKIIDFDDKIIWQRKYIEIFKLINIIRKEKSELGFILDRHYLASLFGFFSGIKFRIGFDRKGAGFANNLSVKYGSVHHEILYNLDLLQKVKLNAKVDTKMEVFLSKDDEKFAENFIKDNKLDNFKLIGIMAGGAENPGQKMYIRRWPLYHYINLIKRITESFPTVKVLLFGGQSDVKINEKIIKNCEHSVLNVAGQATIKQSIALMKKCRLFITHDSGPMHMAAAVGVPVISIFGPVHPLCKAPLGKIHTYIWKPDLSGALCDNEGRFPKKIDILECMDKILPSEILGIIKSKYRELFNF